MKELTATHYHHLPLAEVLTLLGSHREQGLDPLQVEERRAEFGPNIISGKKGTSPLLRFLLQFHQPLIYILIVSGVVTGVLGEWVDSGVIFGVVLVNGLAGYIQEAKAVNALAALARTMITEATVLRQGEKQRLPATALVPGDIVFLQSGDKVPADLRLLQSRELQIAEAPLTGESLPVAKDPALLDLETVLAERRNMAYASTLVTSGQGLGVVIHTGDATEVGRISQLLSEVVELDTPLTRKINEFSNLLLYVILALAAATIGVGLLRGQSFLEMLMAAVALAVGAIPEGLPAAVTITLAIGVSRMAKRQAIIRKLPAVETLGSTTVICTDKTGTLTEDQMTVQEIWAGGQRFRVSGSGYGPETGTIVSSGDPARPASSPALDECLRAGLFCNDSRILRVDGSWRVEGDPTEGALLTAAAKGGLYPERGSDSTRLDTVPFASAQQYMATLHGSSDGPSRWVYLKGAVEPVLARCRYQSDLEGRAVALDSAGLLRVGEGMAAQGLRVLALARKEMDPATAGIHPRDLSGEFVFLGLQGMIDPPRPEAIAAVRICQAAGIMVKMITGDHPATAVAIARQVGLCSPDLAAGITVLTGAELGSFSDYELRARAVETVVFARATPEQKLRLVEALQAQGQVVAMTGDGVNDAPALKRADIGVAMGISGTEVAKEAADMVLARDNFSAIEQAVEEGRGVFANLTKFIVWALPANLGEGLVILVAVFLGVTLPILPVQILWINMTTAGFLGLALAFEPKEEGIMLRPPRAPAAPVLAASAVFRICLVSFLMMGAAFWLFSRELAGGAPVGEARTAAVNLFVIIELFYLFNCRSLEKPVFSLGFGSNPWVVGGAVAMFLLQLAYTYLPLLNRLFQSTPISLSVWGRILGAGVVVFLAIELEKMLWRVAGKR